MDSIDSRVVELLGMKWNVNVYHDEDGTPYDADCYSREDIAAWKRGEWEYVGIEVTPVDMPAGVDVGASLWAIEWGTLPEHNAPLDLDYYLADPDGHVAALVGEARATLLGIWNALSRLPLISV